MNPQFHIQIPRSGAAKCHVVVSQQKICVKNFLWIFNLCIKNCRRFFLKTLLHCLLVARCQWPSNTRRTWWATRRRGPCTTSALPSTRSLPKIFFVLFFNRLNFVGSSKHDQAFPAVRLGACKCNFDTNSLKNRVKHCFYLELLYLAFWRTKCIKIPNLKRHIFNRNRWTWQTTV